MTHNLKAQHDLIQEVKVSKFVKMDVLTNNADKKEIHNMLPVWDPNPVNTIRRSHTLCQSFSLFQVLEIHNA